MSSELHVQLLTKVLHAKSLDGGDEAVYDALRVVIGMHKPRKVRHTDANSCPVHSYHAAGKGVLDITPEMHDACPDCEVTYPDRCSSRTCLDCMTYPCETLRNINAVFAGLKR